jgi:Fe-S cluster biogenesis protein NfuA
MFLSKQNQYFLSVEEVLNRIRPAMQADGGNVELVSAEESGIISVRLQGTCLSCPSAGLTLKQGIERTLKEHLDWVTEVVRVI